MSRIFGESPIVAQSPYRNRPCRRSWRLVGIGYYVLSNPGADSGSAGGSTASGPGFTLVATDRTMGNPKAPVVLIEYGAPSCPICAYFAQNEFPQLKQNYIDTGKIFYVFRVFPAARRWTAMSEKMARCLPEDKYFAFIDLLLRNQPKWDVRSIRALPMPHGAPGPAGPDRRHERRTGGTVHRQQGRG